MRGRGVRLIAIGACQPTLMTALLIALIGLAAPASAAIRVNPTGVNVNGQGATSVFLTFAPLQGYVAAEALWCGDLIATGGPFGPKCDPSTIYGVLPARYNWSARSGIDAFTDIMSIPPSVTRRAYFAAADGKSAEFFYVRRFVHPSGSPDQYVAVTCRLTAGGARVPLSLVDIRLAFDLETPVLQVKSGESVSPFTAHIQYTGSGRLKGRWEIVLPGQEVPTDEDLLTEGTLPAEHRGTQRRYAEIERFNVFLTPVGRFTLKGPDPARLPTGVSGQYLILLRVEASDDKEADSDLALLGAGRGVVHSGGVAGFPMPVLRYIVGEGGSGLAPVAAAAIEGLFPASGTTVRTGESIDVRWTIVASATYYRLEFKTGDKMIHQAFASRVGPTYRIPPFVLNGITTTDLSWRVVALDDGGRTVAQSSWARLVVVP